MPSRWLRRLRRALGPARGWIVYHPDYRLRIPGDPFDPLRGERILAFLADHALVRRRTVSLPRPASVENILRVHTAAYLRELDRPETIAAILGRPVGPDEAGRAVERQRLIAGGTIQATRIALRTGGPVVHLGGGLHHAAPDQGMGFCIFNDVAIAVARLRARQFRDPILVVDLDLHDGNGTRAAFADDPSVHTYSIHNAAWDDLPASASTGIELGTGIGDGEYLDALRDTLPGVIRAHRPGLVVYLAGTDPAADDTLGDWEITAAGMLDRDRFVIEQVRAGGRDLPIVVVLAGGYGPAAWRYSARFLGWLLAGRVIEPPAEIDLALRSRQRVRKLLGEHEESADWLDWSLSAEDLDLGRTAAVRLLGRYSASDIERQLEEFGVLRRMRDRGFRRPIIEIEPSSGLGETVRVYGAPDRAELLMEVRLNRSRSIVPGAELLAAEWLLLQDSRAAFEPGAPPLPGQQYPGLGAFPEVVAWLASLCDQLGLDGIGFRSSHYHIAAMGRRHLRFVRPEDEARFDALHAAVADLPLRDAAVAVAEGRVRDAATGEPVRWNDVAMVLPVSERLRRYFDGRRERAAAAPPAVRSYRLVTGLAAALATALLTA